MVSSYRHLVLRIDVGPSVVLLAVYLDGAYIAHRVPSLAARPWTGRLWVLLLSLVWLVLV